MASGGSDGRVVIWDASSGEQVHALEGGHGGGAVYSVCFSGDGGRVASGGSDGRVVIWDASSGEQVHALEGGHGGREVNSVCFSGDGGRVAYQQWRIIRSGDVSHTTNCVYLERDN